MPRKRQRKGAEALASTDSEGESARLTPSKKEKRSVSNSDKNHIPLIKLRMPEPHSASSTAAAPPASPAKPRKPPSACGSSSGVSDKATEDCRQELEISEEAVNTNAQKAKKDSNAQKATNPANKEASNDAREPSRSVDDLAQKKALDAANAEKRNC